MNHKQLLMDFYLKLLSISVDSEFRILNQSLYSNVLSALAIELDVDEETVQRIFERMAAEDK